MSALVDHRSGSGDDPTVDGSAVEIPAVDVPASVSATVDVPAADNAAADNAAADNAAADSAAADIAAADVRAADSAAADMSAADTSAADMFAADTSAADTFAADGPASDIAAAESPAVGIPAAGATAGAGRAVYEAAVDEPASGGTQVVQDGPVASPAQRRVDFGAHLEANYQRLVAQLYAITLDPGEAHDVVQDAYSRAWREWAVIGRSPDPSAWIRRVAVRSTIRSWRRLLALLGVGRTPHAGDGVDSRTGALLDALGRLPAPERRAVVLFHMVGSSLGEIAAVEQVSLGTVSARLSRARHVVTEGMAEVLPEVLGIGPGGSDDGYDGPGYQAYGDYDGAAAGGGGYAGYGVDDGYGGAGGEGVR